MQVWNLADRSVEMGHPEVLCSRPGGRAVAIHLEEGAALGEHQVHEATWLVVTRGRVRVADTRGVAETIGVGGLAAFDPHERHEVQALEDAMVLLLLAPWPGPGRDRWMHGPGRRGETPRQFAG
jgi:quercetin dioxygenase-like cupin family protein